MNKSIPTELIERVQNDEFTEDVLSLAIGRLRRSLSQTDPVANAIMALMVRIANTWTSIHALSSHSNPLVRRRCRQDVGALFRIIFEAWIQLAYILRDPAKRQEHAQLYLDFSFVERMKLLNSVLSHDTNLTQLLRSSPMRATGESQLKADFERVASQFRGKRGSVRRTWYEGTLRDLAKSIGMEAQYDVWIALYHGCIHSSIDGCRNGALMDIGYASFWGSQVAGHAVRACLEYGGLRLPGNEAAWLEAMTEGVLGDLPDEVAKGIIASRSKAT